MWFCTSTLGYVWCGWMSMSEDSLGPELIGNAVHAKTSGHRHSASYMIGALVLSALISGKTYGRAVG
jgi:hypothetical protein